METEKTSLTEKIKQMLEKSSALQIDYLKELDENPDVKVLEKSIDRRLEETSEINQAYVQMLKKEPYHFDTLYTAIDILAKNDETTNDKIEVVGKMLKELNRQLMNTARLQNEQLEITVKLIKALANINQKYQGR